MCLPLSSLLKSDKDAENDPATVPQAGKDFRHLDGGVSIREVVIDYDSYKALKGFLKTYCANKN